MSTPAERGARLAGIALSPATGWLRSQPFDLMLIVGVLTLALLLGGIASAVPALFVAVLTLELWLLAYPHVASSYTRIAFDRPSRRTHWFLLWALPPLVLAATAGATWLGGVVVLNTAYYVWQSWHYSRQSYGIARAYNRKAGAPPKTGDGLSSLVIFAFPIWGLLHRIEQRPSAFYDGPLWVPTIPRLLVLASGALALLALAAWTWRRLRVLGDAPQWTGHTLFVLSHVVITAVSYLIIPDITRGWLFLNIWHNAQYLLFVWNHNAQQFRSGVDPERPVLSGLSQPQHVLRYVIVCLLISAVFYFALGQITRRMSWQLLPVFLVCHQAVNFHHYLVDAVVWRRKRGSAAR